MTIIATNLALVDACTASKLRTWSEFLSRSVDANLGLRSHRQFVLDLVGRHLGRLQHLDERLVLDERALGRREAVQQVVLELLHLALVGRHFLEQLDALRLQLLRVESGIVTTVIFPRRSQKTGGRRQLAPPSSQ